MDNLISRQAAINVIAKWMLEYGGYGEEHGINALKQAAEEIKALPPAEPKLTPCKKGLPKKSGHYLVQTEDGITIMEYTLGNPHYHESPAFVSDVLGRCNGYVIAWAPLPKPYRERREE